VVTAEHQIYASDVTIVQTYGYAAGSDVPVFTKTYSTVGVLTTTGGQKAPGDAAALMRFATAARTPKNHPVYLFNYWHGVYNTATDNDRILTGQATAYGTYAGLWLSGFSDGTLTLVRAGPNGATATGQALRTFITHRDFPR
jgi:hypothetical protein